MSRRRTIVEMVKEYQCPGCTCGSDPETCSSYNLDGPGDGWQACRGHVPGTLVLPGVGTVALGLPKGFNRYGLHPGPERDPKFGWMQIRLFTAPERTFYDKFNVPVWKYLDENGVLFVRCWSPRINATYVDVIQGACLGMKGLEKAIDAGEFMEGMD